jgi:hypothetical protein
MRSRELLIPFLIVLSVFLFNLPNIFVDYLWHDDGAWYYRASEGMNIHKFDWRNKIAILTPFRDWFYSYGMVYMGLPFTRGVFVFIMALSSLLLYYLYRSTFGIDSKVAVAAAVIPNILPSLKGIPVGLNASYAMWGLLPIIASLLLLTSAYKKEGYYSWLLFGMAFTVYAIGLNLAASTNFLIPCVIFFFLFYYPKKKIQTVLVGLPFLLLGLWQVYKQYLYSHKTPTAIPPEVMLDRIRHFFEMSSFLPFNQPYSIYITLFLSVLGLAGLIFMSSNLYRQPGHFNYHNNYYRLLLTAWPLCWIFFNSVVYIAANPDFRAHDYAYIFNFGIILLQTAGMVYVLTFLLKLLNIKNGRNYIISFFLICLIIFTGIQRINNYAYSRHEDVSRLIRNALGGKEYPLMSQIIILDTKVAHSGEIRVNSGFLRYYLKRNDIKGLIGPDRYPNDVFAENRQFKCFIESICMGDLNPDKPIFAFRKKNDSLQPVELLFRTVSSSKAGKARLEWIIYDISNKQPPRKLATGIGVKAYNHYMKNNLPPVFHNADIAFAPKGVADDFVDAAVADSIAGKKGLINKPVKIGEYFKLRNVLLLEKDNHFHLQLLVRVDSVPAKGFKLSYSLDGKKMLVPLCDFVTEGDNILINTVAVNMEKLKQGVSLGFLNAGTLPQKPLTIEDEQIKSNHIILRYDQSQ